MVGMKKYLSCRFTDITPRTPRSNAPVKVKRFLTTTYPVLITLKTFGCKKCLKQFVSAVM